MLMLCACGNGDVVVAAFQVTKHLESKGCHCSRCCFPLRVHVQRIRGAERHRWQAAAGDRRLQRPALARLNGKGGSCHSSRAMEGEREKECSRSVRSKEDLRGEGEVSEGRECKGT